MNQMSKSKSPFTRLSPRAARIQKHINAFDRALKPLAGYRADSKVESHQVMRLFLELSTAKKKISDCQRALAFAIYQDFDKAGGSDE